MVAYSRIAPNPRFNQSLTISSAKSAHRFGCVSPVWPMLSAGQDRPGTRKSRDADLRYADLLDAAHQDALAPGTPAPFGGKRRQRRHSQVYATRSRPTEFGPDQGAARLGDARAHQSGPHR